VFASSDKDGKSIRETKVSTEPAAIRAALGGFADRCAGWELKRRLWEYGCTANWYQPGCQ